MNLTYEQAYAELQQILQALQEEQVSVDELGERSRRAAELLRYCREKLRHTEAELETLFPEEKD